MQHNSAKSVSQGKFGIQKIESRSIEIENIVNDSNVIKLPISNKPKICTDHRKRLREKFSGEINHFSEHEVLEYLLTYAIPRKDTSEIAHNLVRKFGSFSAVFDANPSQLQDVKGLGDNSIHLLTFMKKFMSFYSSSTTKHFNKKRYNRRDELHEYVVDLFIGRIYEVCFLLCFDNLMRIKNVTLMQEGTINEVNLHIREVVKVAIDNVANVVVIAHNHPGGITTPSNSDLWATIEIRKALNSINVNFIDHILVADNRAISIRELKIPDVFPESDNW